MCFSAGASFATAAFLTLLGIYTSQKTINHPRSWMLGMIPLFFGMQQASEGVLWLGLTGSISAGFVPFATVIFLIFALVIWPAWVPTMVYVHEAPGLRKKLLTAPVIVGLITALYLLSTIIMYGVHAEARSGHIYYYHQGGYADYAAIGYLIATIVPFFIAKNRFFTFFGALLASSCLLAYVLWQVTFASIWCFFAAILSSCIAIYAHYKYNN